MFNYEKYLRVNRLPLIFCSGCGDGTILKSILRAVDKLEIEKDKMVMVSGIGCSSRTPGYVDFNTLHTTHGRAITFATGIKLATPELNVLVVTGDGDALAIGGNHFIHAARRNMDLTVVIFNNNIYGMTGGQYSPTTGLGKYAATAPYGMIESTFDICDLAKSAGASYVARITAFHSKQVTRYVQQGMENKGFSVIEVMVPCHTTYGRRNKYRDPVTMFEELKTMTVTEKAAEKMTPEELEGKTRIGVFVNNPRPDYGTQYDEVITKAKQIAEKRNLS